MPKLLLGSCISAFSAQVFSEAAKAGRTRTMHEAVRRARIIMEMRILFKTQPASSLLMNVD